MPLDQIPHIKALSLAACFMAAGCAGRAPAPVAVVQPVDQTMGCTAISAEAQANAAKMQELAGEQGGKAAQNIAAGVVGLFVWPAWFLMDLQGSASTETAALNSRNQYLATLATERRCGTGRAGA